MKPGTIVTYNTINPTSKTSRIGVVLMNDDDQENCVLICEGAFTIKQADANTDYTVTSRSVDTLTELAPSIAKILTKQ